MCATNGVWMDPDVSNCLGRPFQQAMTVSCVNVLILHCKDESVYCTPKCTLNVQTVCVLGHLVCSTHFRFYSVGFIGFLACQGLPGVIWASLVPIGLWVPVRNPQY